MRNPTAPARRVLVVDDNLDYLEVTIALIRALGCEVDFAVNGYAALLIAPRFRPHVVMLDVDLPDGDGRELARPLKQLRGLESVRVYCVTGRGAAERRLSLAAGCDDHFVKPLEGRVLASLLRTG